ncbi:HD domain-containing protein [Paenibacillus chitinolyticus]|uniref:HD domain-containing protein n=1 Tax=Paenibacillus chitinolyticus TaxID=79263 RepID=UPI003665675A
MEPQTILEKAYQLAGEKLKDEPTGHDWWHIHRVTRLAKLIAKKENADEFVCEMAALLHDLVDEKLVDDKKRETEKLAEWLADNEVPGETIRHILDIIGTLSFQGGTGTKMSTLEGRIVQDADRIDAIGAIGIARTFVYAGARGSLIYDPQLEPRSEMTAEQYRDGKSTAINHFYEKLLKLKERMNTETGRQLAEERHEFMEQYLVRFYSEWNLGNGNGL